MYKSSELQEAVLYLLEKDEPKNSQKDKTKETKGNKEFDDLFSMFDDPIETKLSDTKKTNQNYDDLNSLFKGGGFFDE